MLRAHERLQLPVTVAEHGGLYRLDGLGVVQGCRRLPRRSVVGRPLEMNRPSPCLGARGAEQLCVAQLDRLVLDGSKDPVRHPPRLGPCLSIVERGPQHAPPRRWRWADLVEQQQWPAFREEQYRVPGRMPHAVRLDAVGDFHRRCPTALDLAGQPDADVRMALPRSSKPRGDQAGRRLDDRRRVAGGGGRGVGDELGEDDGGIRLAGQRARQAADDEEREEPHSPSRNQVGNHFIPRPPTITVL